MQVQGHAAQGTQRGLREAGQDGAGGLIGGKHTGVVKAESGRAGGLIGGQAGGGTAKGNGQHIAEQAVWSCPEGCGPWASAVMNGRQLYCGVKGCKKPYSYSQCEIHSLHASLEAAKASVE